MVKEGKNYYYSYNDNGARIKKETRVNNEPGEYYLIDHTGRTLGVYDMSTMRIKSANIYGSGLAGTVEYPTPVTTENSYHVKDHLGSIRITLRETAGGFEVSSAQDYYPYGEYINSTVTGSSQNKYKYTEKERDKETGYDYFGARYYNSRLSLWQSIDPLAEKYPGWSPYNYTICNPLRLVDPNGMDVSDWYNINGEYLGMINDGVDAICKTELSFSDIKNINKTDYYGYDDLLNNSVAKKEDVAFWNGVISYELSCLASEFKETSLITSIVYDPNVTTLQTGYTAQKVNGENNLAIKDMNYMLKFNTEDGSSIAFSSRDNIQNSLVHEIGHIKFSLSKSLFSNPWPYKEDHRYTFDFQEKHSSYMYTTSKYKGSLENYKKKVLQ